MNNTTLPHQWRRVALGDVLEEKLDRSWPGAELLSVTNDRGVILQSESAKRDTSSVDKSKYKRVCPNDIVYNTMRMWQGVSARSSYEGIVSPAYTVCRPTSEVDPRYIAALLKHPDLVIQFHRFAQGLVDDTLNLKYQAFAKISAILPPLPEQRRIAEMLDTVDAAIQQTEALIAKLTLMKAGLLHDLLTRGLDAQGQLRDPIAHPEQFKDSPLGRIPREWEVKPVGEVFDMQLGKMLSKAAKTGHNPFPYLANRNVQWDYVDLSDLEWMDFNEAEREKFSLLPGDLLVCEGGDVGRTAMWRGEQQDCFFQKAIHRLRPKDSSPVLPSYMLRFMRFAVYHGFLVSLSSQTSITHLTREKFALLPLPLPQMQEQEEIVKIFDAHDARLRAEEAYCDKLKQLKQGLMRDLLTGRVRVQAAEAAQ